MPVQHIALLRFKAGTTPQTIDATFAALRQLTRDIPGSRD